MKFAALVNSLVLATMIPFSPIARADETPMPKPITYIAPTRENYLKLRDEMEAVLRKDMLSAFFPRCIDNDHGGFYCNFSRDWTRSPRQEKFSVYQGRMTWVASQIVMLRPDLKQQYLPYARHGLDFLNNVLWDKQDGGPFWGLSETGQIAPPFGEQKNVYGISFVLYGAAAEYQATGDPQALDLAQRIFRWMDAHAHDAKNGGYFEALTRDGRVVQPDPNLDRQRMGGVGPVGQKSMNTHIHLLESVAQLYQVWPDPLVKQRLEELLHIVRDKVCLPRGAMNQFFTPDWQVVPDLDSYGHDIETAFLLTEAAEVLGQPDDPKTQDMAKKIVDHTLAYGWDKIYGGVYHEGTFDGQELHTVKDWWTQFESLNSLLLMHEKYGKDNDAYFKAFQRQWQWIKDYQLDHEYGGVYEIVDRDGTVTNHRKAQMWTECYHDSRALLHVTARLEKLAGQ